MHALTYSLLLPRHNPRTGDHLTAQILQDVQTIVLRQLFGQIQFTPVRVVTGETSRTLEKRIPRRWRQLKPGLLPRARTTESAVCNSERVVEPSVRRGSKSWDRSLSGRTVRQDRFPRLSCIHPQAAGRPSRDLSLLTSTSEDGGEDTPLGFIVT